MISHNVHLQKLTIYSTRRRDSKLFFPMTEAAVFELLGLEWIHPTYRNADV